MSVREEEEEEEGREREESKSIRLLLLGEDGVGMGSPLKNKPY